MKRFEDTTIYRWLSPFAYQFLANFNAEKTRLRFPSMGGQATALLLVLGGCLFFGFFNQLINWLPLHQNGRVVGLIVVVGIQYGLVMWGAWYLVKDIFLTRLEWDVKFSLFICLALCLILSGLFINAMNQAESDKEAVLCVAVVVLIPTLLGAGISTWSVFRKS